MQTGVTVGSGVFVATTLGVDVMVGGGSGVEVGGGAGGFPQDERITAAIMRMKICFFMFTRLDQLLIQTSIARQNKAGQFICPLLWLYPCKHAHPKIGFENELLVFELGLIQAGDYFVHACLIRFFAEQGQL